MKVTIAIVVAEAELQAGLPPGTLVGPARVALICRQRHRAIWAVRKLVAGASLPLIGLALGGRDHTSILNGLRRHEALIARDDQERLESVALLSRVREICSVDRVRVLDAIDRDILAAVMGGAALPEAAAHAGVAYRSAEARLTGIARACAHALGRGLSDWSAPPRFAVETSKATLTVEPVVPPPPPPIQPVTTPAEPIKFSTPVRPPVLRSRDLSDAGRAPLAPGRANGRFGSLGAGIPDTRIPNRPEGSGVSAADRALIDAALQAGKVTLCPRGQAAGLTQTEQAFWAAPPPKPVDGRGWRSPSALRTAPRLDLVK